ncbi:hypothetical protein NOF55_10855 [Rhizobiaceae bacterium BDR2-2]|uniref:Uncharacterized protein n=1 Tax=Ectorhizobium quercum TaxID=2965071 RepID=A0AAE3N040_9HYPH|nr:hypothetical protein [Ectorhizobium quercum]MCX8997601.1 hypothetical protein [Ectorhizobium quercum]
MEKQTRKRGASLFAAFMASSPAVAQEQALIWQPSRIGKSAYSLRVGMNLPQETGTKAGIDFDVRANDSGAVREVPTRLWSSWSHQTNDAPGKSLRRNLNMDFSVLSGSGTVRLSSLRTWIATPAIDMEVEQSYSSFYNGEHNTWNGVNTSHSVQLATDKGTRFILRGVTTGDLDDVRTGVGIEQKLGSNITIRSDFDHSADTLNTSVSARYTTKW